MAFHPNGVVVATCGADGAVNVFDVRMSALLQHHKDAADVRSLRFHPSGAFLLTGGGDSTVKVWDLKEGHLFYTLRAHTAPVNGVAFSPKVPPPPSCALTPPPSKGRLFRLRR
jgi:centriolar protein POC1